MELYRTLRISIFALVATGAYAIWDVDRHPLFLLLTLGAGVIAHLTVDAGRIRPPRNLFAGLFSMALLIQFLLPAIDLMNQGYGFDAVRRMMHFLCAVQIVMLFTALKSPVTAYCAANLFIVVVSGILNPGIGIVARLFLFLAASTWALFLYSLWRERERFQGEEHRTPAREMGESAGAPPKLRLSDRTFRQGLALTGSLSVVCLLCGFLLFFTWPRLDMLSMVERLIPRLTPKSSGRPGHGAFPAPTGSAGTNSFNRSLVGLNEEESIDLTQIGALNEDDTIALEVEFSSAIKDWTPDGESIYLRSLAYSHFSNERWSMAEARNSSTLEAPAGADAIDFPARDVYFLAPPHPNPPPELTRAPATILQTITVQGQATSVYHALAPVRKLKPAARLSAKVVVDEEGCLHTLERQRLQTETSYEVISNRPVYVEELPPNAATGSVRLLTERYFEWRKGAGAYAEALSRLAQDLTTGLKRDVDKARRISAYLSHPRNFRYSLERPGHGLGEFLFGREQERSGPCGYFATAFVLLSRAAGLPARLAGGYTYTPLPGEGAAQRITIRNYDAHAWGEIYFKDYGWVAFDPTPSGGNPERPEIAQRPPAPDPRVTSGQRPAPQPAFKEPSWLESYWDYFKGYDQQHQSEIYGSLGDKLRNTFGSLAAMITGSGQWGAAGAVVLWGLLLAMGIGVLIGVLRGQERRRGPVANLPPRAKAAVTFYNELLQVLSKRGYVRRLGQTPREFAEAVVRRGGAALGPVTLVTTMFERIRYGGEDINDEELEQVRQAFHTLQETAPQPAKA